MSLHVNLIAHELITKTNSPRLELIKDLWPDTDGHYICIVLSIVIGIWHACFNKFSGLIAGMIFGSYDKWYEKLVEGIIFAFICYVLFTIIYMVGHDVFYHWGGDYTD